MGRELVRAGRWAALWPAFAVTALVTVASLRRSSTSLLTTMVLGPLAIYVGIFMLSALPNYQEHVGTALPRLLLSLAPIAWLATFLGLRDMLQKSGSTAW
jgi:amino acid permease